MEKMLRRRFAAFVLDGVLLTLLAFPLTLIGQPLVAQLVMFALPFVYFTALESGTRRASLGKRLLGLKVTRGDGKPLDAARALARVAILGAPGLFASAMALIADRFAYLPDDHFLVLAGAGISVALAGCVWTSFFLDEHDRGLPDTLTDTHVIPAVAPEEEVEFYPAQNPFVAAGLGVAAGVLAVVGLVLLERAGGPSAELRAAVAAKAPALVEALSKAADGKRVRLQLTRTEDNGWTLTAVVPTDAATLRSDDKLGPQAETLLETVQREAANIPGLDAAGVRFHTGSPFGGEREFARDLHEEERVPASDGE